MELRPAFSARVMGTTSRASAKALKQMLSGYEEVSASLERECETAISGEPPPGSMAFFFTRQRNTHCASCKLLSASSRMRGLAPLQMMLTVLGAVGPVDLMPVTLVMREPSDETSSIRSALASLSSVNESMSAMGLQPVLCG